jgi:peptidoglycan/LPS O-acetylase OafA/YrhL
MGTSVAPGVRDVRVPSSPQGGATPSHERPSHLRLDVQGLRAVAVLLVVAYHAGLPVSGGFIGVDVFLVISGFVITGMLLREIERTGTVRLREFYSRRVKRLLPALALVTTVVMGLSVFFGSSFGSQQTTASTGLGATYLVANVVIYGEAIEYFSPAADTNPLLHTWTLSVEEQTYLIFPSLLLGSWMVSRLLRRSPPEHDVDPRITGPRSLRASRMGVGVMLVVIGVASFVLSLQVSMGWTSTPPAWAFYSSLARVWEFAIGAGLALYAARLHRIHPTVALLLGITGAAAILVGAFTLSGAVPYPGVAALLPVVGTAAVITAGFRSTSAVPRTLATKPMVTIGDVSYSWYLWHWPLIVFAAVIWPGKPWVLVAVGVASLLPAFASYLGLERPLRANPSVRGWGVVALLAVCVLVPTAAALALLAGARSSWGNEGLQQMQAQLDARHAEVPPRCEGGAAGEPDRLTTCGAIAHGQTHVYLYGNSIAGMYREGLLDASETLDLPLTLHTHSGGFCARLDASGCPEMFVDAFDELLHGGDSGVVVMAGTWDLGSYASGSPEEKAEVLAARLGEIIGALHRAGHHVLIVLPTPRFFYGEEPGTFAPAPPDTGQREPHAAVWRPEHCPASTAQRDPAACGATVDERDVRTSHEIPIAMLRRVAQDTGASTLDLRPRYCTDGVCATNHGNVWMFEDGIHIAAGESHALAPTFTRVLRDIVERRSERQELPGSVAYTYLDEDAVGSGV